MAVDGTQIVITRGMLSHLELSTYVQAMGTAKEIREGKQKISGDHLFIRVSVAALAVILMFAVCVAGCVLGAGGDKLIGWLLGPGIAAGVIGLVGVGAIITFVRMYYNEMVEADREFDEAENHKISCEETLQEMRKEEVTCQQIKDLLRDLEPEQRKQFMTLALKKEENHKIQETFIEFPDELSEVEFSREFAKKIYGSASGELMKKVLEKIGDAKTVEEKIMLMRHEPPEPNIKGNILENTDHGDEKIRARMALQHLEKMDKQEIETFIKGVDKREQGYPYFNLLVNALVDETKDLDLSKLPVSENRARLIACFKYARNDKDEKIMEITRHWWNRPIGSELWVLKDEGLAEWVNFNQIAEIGKQNK